MCPQSPFPPSSSGSPWQAQKNSKATKAVAPPAGAKGGPHADNQLTNHSPDPGQVLGRPTTPPRPLRLPTMRLAQVWVSEELGTPAADASVLQWRSLITEMLRWRLRKAARKQVTSGQSCGRLPGGKGQGGHSKQSEQQYTNVTEEYVF